MPQKPSAQYVNCIHCTRGPKGEKSCAAGAHARSVKGSGCFLGQWMPGKEPKTINGVQEELIALRLREREMEATKALYLRALGKVAPGVHLSKIPDRPNGERFLVVRALNSALGRRVGQAGSLVRVDHVGSRKSLLTLEFADGGRDRLLPWELVRLDA